MILNGKELKKMVASYGIPQVVAVLESVLELGRTGKPGGVKSEEFSIRELFESLVDDGREAVRYFDPRMEGSTPAMEADVSTSLFSNISGQIIYSRFLEAYNNPDYVFSQLIPNVSTSFLDGEKIAGLAGLGDDAAVVAEGGQFPRSTFGEDWIETPATAKRGNIVSLTKESIFGDRTGQILRRASAVGEYLGLNKEKRLVDLAVGVTNNYKRQGVSINTFQTATPFINDHANLLADWTDVETAELLFSGMVDPNTGESISVGGMNVVTSGFKHRTAQRILNATNVRHTAGGIETESVNPLRGAYTPYRSELLAGRIVAGLAQTLTNAKEWWVIGNFAKAFAYMEVFPISMAQAPANSYLSFERDIVAEYKASERGAAAVMDPRYVVRNKHA